MDTETLPFQVNLGYQVPRTKEADYIGRAALESAREQVEAGHPPYSLTLVGLRLGGAPIEEYAPDFWLVSEHPDTEPVGYVTSPWYSPELGANIAMARVPVALATLGRQFHVHLPEVYAEQPGRPVAATVVEMPFRPSVNPNTRERLHDAGLDAAT
jgi:aminomethyltransferase